MKRISLFIGFVLMYVLTNAQTPSYYYYYEGKKQYLTLNTEYAFLSLEEADISDSINQFAVDVDILRSDNAANKQFRSKAGKNRFYTELKLKKQPSTQYFAKIASIKRLHSKAIVSPYFKMDGNDKIGLSNFFYVKLKAESDTTLLVQMAKREKCAVIEQDQFMPLWFVLSTTELSELNAMECANAFYESGHYAAAEPNLMPDKILATNDTCYSNQWGLKNTGQYGGTSGIDIKAESAWNIARGNGIKVAVIDEGVNLTHSDLAGNMHSQSYDTQNRTSPSIIRGNHGTACAGIVGTIQNNNEWISGVAPNCTLISVSRQLSNVSNLLNVQQDLATGINWAWQNGADVLSWN